MVPEFLKLFYVNEKILMEIYTDSKQHLATKETLGSQL